MPNHVSIVVRHNLQNYCANKKSAICYSSQCRLIDIVHLHIKCVSARHLALFRVYLGLNLDLVIINKGSAHYRTAGVAYRQITAIRVAIDVYTASIIHCAAARRRALKAAIISDYQQVITSGRRRGWIKHDALQTGRAQYIVKHVSAADRCSITGAGLE